MLSCCRLLGRYTWHPFGLLPLLLSSSYCLPPRYLLTLWLQDAPFWRLRWPELLIWEHPIFLSDEYVSWDAEQIRETKRSELREERLRRQAPQQRHESDADTTAAGIAEAQPSAEVLQSMFQNITTLVAESSDKQVST